VNIKIYHITRYLTPAVKDCPVFVCILCDTFFFFLFFFFFFCATTLIESWLSRNNFSFEAILDLSCLFYKFRLFQVIPDIIFPSGLGPSYWSTCKWFPFVYFLYSTGFRHSIYVSKPIQSLSFNIVYYAPLFY
jgi:hypothetical protein